MQFNAGTTKKSNSRKLNSRAGRLGGYSLPFVLGVSTIFAFSSFAMVSAVASGSKTSGDMLRRRKAFYACDGLSRVVTKLSQSYMATTPTPDSAGLATFVTSQGGGSNLPNLAPANFDVTDFVVETVGDSLSSTPIPSGAFRGMNARQDTIRMVVEARHQALNYVCRTEQTVTLGKVALFQFYVFSDTPFDGHPGPLMTLNGRVHVNGDACPAGQMNIDRITASGALRHSLNGNCAYVPSNNNTTQIKRTDGSFSEFSATNDHDSPGWKVDAITEWGGNALDEEHDVPELKPPTVGTPLAQNGANASDARAEATTGIQTATESNVGSLRFLIDPVVNGEPADVQAQKLAFLSDIRIIDGVWYKDSGAWPGTPIWSDHPGSFSFTNAGMGTGLALAGNQVGQRNIAASQGWGTVPMRYSYYATNSLGGGDNRLVADRITHSVANSVPAVISYGSTNRLTTTPFNTVYPTVNDPNAIWEPGGWTGSELCPRDYSGIGVSTGDSLGFNGAAVPLTGGLVEWFGSPAFAGISSPIHQCNNAGVFTPLTSGKILLNAARQGFRENHRGGPYGPMPATRFRSQVLPANFDLMAFQAAMQDVSAGELGSHFSGGSDFNGIVWITYTWQNSLRGLNGGSFADVSPMNAQGTSDDTRGSEVEMVTDFYDPGTIATATPASFVANGSQPIPPIRVGVGGTAGATLQNNGAASQRELPFPLCSRDAGVMNQGYLSGNVPGGTIVNTVASGGFIVQDCNLYNGSSGGRVNAVRVMNGRDLDPEVFPKGLTIATNIPMFVLGAMNTLSVPLDDTVLPQTAGSRTWVPLMLAGDVMYHASNAWTDASSPWSIQTSVSDHRRATDTIYNIAELIGWVPSDSGIGGTRFHNLQGFQEFWGTSRSHNINGAVAIGWRAVYHRNNRTSGGGTAYTPPMRNWTFDTNYRLFSNQPPGTPTFDIAATKKFKRDSIQ